MDERLAVSVEEAGRLLGISRGLAYELATRGDLPTIRLGRRLVVPRKDLERMLEQPVVGVHVTSASPTPGPAGEMIANAGLIAAAPELLAACEAVLEHDVANLGTEHEFFRCYTYGQEIPPVIAQLKAAIAKAKGEVA